MQDQLGGRQYLIYQPARGQSFQARLPAGRYGYEWFNPETGERGETGDVELNGKKKTFTNAFPGTAVLYLEKR